MDTTLVKHTRDGRAVEVTGGWICLAGAPEADRLVPVTEHPNRQAILAAVPDATHMAGRLPLTSAEASVARAALMAAQAAFDASPAGIAQRLRQVLWDKAAAEGVE